MKFASVSKSVESSIEQNDNIKRDNIVFQCVKM